MKLFIDTTTKYVSLITFSENEIHRAVQYQGNNDHTTTIYKHLNKIDLTQLEAIYVTSGPGSYTGVRIGVLVAKTLAHELNIDLYAINTLELFYLGTNQPTLLDARGKKYFKFDGSTYSQIAYDQHQSEFLIENFVDSQWLTCERVISKFSKINPLEIQIDYMKDAI